MKRRQLFSQVAVGAVSAGTLAACSQRNQILKASVGQTNRTRIEWRMATSWTESLDVVFGTSKLLCERVSELTDGNFVITPYPAGGIAPPLEILDTVGTATAECGHTAGFYYTAKNPALAFATTVPFGLNPAQHIAWLYGGSGLEALRKIYAHFNVINFPGGSTGNQMGGWFKKKFQSLDEIKGLKMRIPGLGGKVWKQLGAETQNLPPAEIGPALEQGKIDAAEWVGPYEDEKLGLNKFAQFYYYPGWHEPGTTYEFIVNLPAWNKLPKDYQTALSVAAFEAHTKMIARYDALNREALQRLETGGTKLVLFSPELLKAAEKTAFSIYEENASQDATFRELYTNWKTFRKAIFEWNHVNEASYSNIETARS